MNLGRDFGSRTAPTGGKSYPEAKGYEFVITNIVDAPSKKGDPMVYFQADIVGEEFDGGNTGKRLYQLYKDDDGFDRLKGIMDTIIEANPAMFPEAEIDWENFVEQRLIGCKVGGVLKWSDDGKYTNLWYFTTVEEALAKEPAKRPERIDENDIVDETTGKKLF
jgi:hypothetical protein